MIQYREMDLGMKGVVSLLIIDEDYCNYHGRVSCFDNIALAIQESS